MNSRTKKLLGVAGIIVITAFIILNVDVSIRRGVNGTYQEVHMPLYVKWIQFLARHYEYTRIAKEITAGQKLDEEKVLALFQWTHENIRPITPDMPRMDDHILNIIIRGYGTSEQAQDVFVNLCVYAGMPAFWQRICDKDRRVRYSLSFVKIDGKWRVFDVYFNKYFRTSDGRIASIDDLISNKALLDNAGLDDIIVGGIPYKELYYNLSQFAVPPTLRSEKQMPFKRILFELKKILNKKRSHAARLDRVLAVC